jgi:hypothetical protein
MWWPGAGQFRNTHLLADIGAGLRFELSTKYQDAAQGKNSHTWSMGVGRGVVILEDEGGASASGS